MNIQSMRNSESRIMACQACACEKNAYEDDDSFEAVYLSLCASEVLMLHTTSNILLLVLKESEKIQDYSFITNKRHQCLLHCKTFQGDFDYNCMWLTFS